MMGLQMDHLGICLTKCSHLFCSKNGVTVGGVVGFTPEHYTRVNGYSNLYYGWGGEDNDMGNRYYITKMS